MSHHAGHRRQAARRIYGAPFGILMLEARFPRIPGDMGNAATWPFPVLYRVVKGATPERVVLKRAAGLLGDFLAAAAELVDAGCGGDHHQLRVSLRCSRRNSLPTSACPSPPAP